MKYFIVFLAFAGVMAFGTACNRDSGIEREDIQREEALGADDIRETDTYDRSVPVENEEEMDMNRDDVLENDADLQRRN